jgi:hypothetical protein
VQAQRERDMLYTATKERLTESTPFRAIAKKSLFPCTVLLHDYVYIVMLFAFYALSCRTQFHTPDTQHPRDIRRPTSIMYL